MVSSCCSQAPKGGTGKEQDGGAMHPDNGRPHRQLSTLPQPTTNGGDGMPISKETLFITDDGEKFIFEEDAIRHDLRMRGSAKLAAFLGEVPGMSDAVD